MPKTYEREVKVMPALYTKVVDEAQGIVDAIVSVMGVLDYGDDIIESGAFQKTVTERGRNILVLDAHSSWSVMDILGIPLELREIGRDELPEETRAVTLEADDVGQLLVDWLRELLYWHDIDRLAFVRAEFDTVSARQLAATVYCARYTSPPVREIKGVTYHQLTVEQRGAAWFARVIFDV